MWPLDYPIYSLPQWNDGWRRCFTGHMDECSRKLHPSLKSRNQVQTLSHALALELTITQGKPTQACWECWGDDGSCFTHPENDILSHLPVKTTNNDNDFCSKSSAIERKLYKPLTVFHCDEIGHLFAELIQQELWNCDCTSKLKRWSRNVTNKSCQRPECGDQTLQRWL